jgi:tetratricopeptide (TPR) repeat protein
MSTFIFRLLLSFAALLPLGLIHAAGDAGAAPYPEIDAWLRRAPLIFFVAKGPANACGPGCSEWIAAEGRFDSDAPQRFRDFLATLSRRDLPLFFNSGGGILKAGADMGLLLREHRMTVGVGRTVPDGCRNAPATDEACRHVMQTKAEHRARLITAGARCSSACVVSFAGGSVRQVARDAQLGIHSVRALKSVPGASADAGHRFLRRYLVWFGIDAGLVDAATKISADDVRYLSRDEIARFGIETRNVYETAWLPHLEQDKGPAVLKSVTQPKGASGKEYRTDSIQIYCAGKGPSLWFAYRRELASDEIGRATAVRATAGTAELAVGDRAASSTSVDRRSTATGVEFLAKAIAAPAIVITETFTPAENGPAWSREIKFSTDGLAKAVEDLQKGCRAPSPAVAAPPDDLQTCQAASGDVAMSACTRAIASGRYRGSDLALPYNMRGVIWRAKGELDRAFADIDEAIRLDPNGPRAYYNRGLAWRAKGDLDRAIADYTDAIRLNARYRNAYNDRGSAWRDKGDLDRAIADFDEAIRLDPTYSIAYYNRGLAWRDKGELDRAIADYTEAIRLDPTYAVAYNNRGTVWRDKGDRDRAIADYSEAIRLDPDPKDARAYNNRGLAWRNNGDLDRAIADYSEAIRLDPKYAFAYYNRGFAWRDKDDLDRAIADYTEAVQLEPKNAAYYRNRGYTYFHKGDFTASTADLVRATDLADNAYGMLFRYLARARLKQDGAAELSASAARLKSKDWPYAVIDFYLGLRSLAEMRAAAHTPTETCEAEFYTGAWHLMRGSNAEARTALQVAADTCPKTYVEYAAAVAELKRLEP